MWSNVLELSATQMGILYSIQHMDASWIKEPVIFSMRSLRIGCTLEIWQETRSMEKKNTYLFFTPKKTNRWTAKRWFFMPTMEKVSYFHRCPQCIQLLKIRFPFSVDSINCKQGLLNIPWLGYIKDITWNSSHLVDHIPIMESNGWVMWNMGTWLMTHGLYVLGEPLLHGRLLLRLVFDSAHLLIGILAWSCFWSEFKVKSFHNLPISVLFLHDRFKTGPKFKYPLVNSHSYGKWTIEFGDLPIQRVIFHSYVSLPDVFLTKELQAKSQTRPLQPQRRSPTRQFRNFRLI